MIKKNKHSQTLYYPTAQGFCAFQANDINQDACVTDQSIACTIFSFAHVVPMLKG